jgi:hypothetical protein
VAMLDAIAVELQEFDLAWSCLGGWGGGDEHLASDNRTFF